MTPRQLRSEMLLMRRRDMHEMSEALLVAAQGAQGDPKEIGRLMQSWSRM